MDENRGPARLRVRPADLGDLDRIVDFNRSLADESEGLCLDRDVLQSGVKAILLDSTRGFYLLAELPDAAVGQLLVTTEWSDWRNAYFWWLQSVYVRPTMRQRGVFRALYQHVLGMARTRGDLCGLRLYVHRENEAAEKVYENLGMRRLDYRMMETDLS